MIGALLSIFRSAASHDTLLWKGQCYKNNHLPMQNFLANDTMLLCSHDHNADFTPRFEQYGQEQYGQDLVNIAIDWA